jgi:ATP-dependent RNA helicase DDX31/DBP7
MVVFLASCDTVDFAHDLVSQQFSAMLGPDMPAHVMKLHGNMAQADRFESFLSFKNQDSSVLLCTDVAARGLDFPEVACILQFESPGPVAEYVHRIGRTARMGRKVNFLKHPYLFRDIVHERVKGLLRSLHILTLTLHRHT